MAPRPSRARSWHVSESAGAPWRPCRHRPMRARTPQSRRRSAERCCTRCSIRRRHRWSASSGWTSKTFLLTHDRERTRVRLSPFGLRLGYAAALGSGGLDEGLVLLVALALASLPACGDDGAMDPDEQENPRDRDDARPDRPRDKPDASQPRAGGGGDPSAGARAVTARAERTAPPFEPVKPVNLGSDLDAPAAATKWTVFGSTATQTTTSRTRSCATSPRWPRREIDDDVNVIVLADFDASQAIAGTNGATFREGAEWLRDSGRRRRAGAARDGRGAQPRRPAGARGLRWPLRSARSRRSGAR